jgi:hypothetical protein
VIRRGCGGAGSTTYGLSGRSSDSDEAGDPDKYTDLAGYAVPEPDLKPPSRQTVVPPPGSGSGKYYQATRSHSFKRGQLVSKQSEALSFAIDIQMSCVYREQVDTLRI